MKIYIAKDWTGFKVFLEPPVLIKCGGMPDIWSGHRLPFNITDSFVENEIPRGQYLERNMYSVIKVVK